MQYLTQPSEHQGKIHDHFNGDVGWRGEQFQDTLVILLFTNRSGSNLLGDYLVEAGGFSGMAEHLNWDFVTSTATKLGINSFNDYLRGLCLHNSRDGRIYGVKASVGQMLMLARWGYFAAFKEVRVLHIEREDTVGQAVSFSIANQTDAWKSGAEAKATPEYRHSEVRHYLTQITEENGDGRIATAALGLPVHRVIYEHLVSEPETVVRDTYAWFGLPVEGLSVRTSMKKQAGPLNEAFKAKFIEQFVKDMTAQKSA